MEVLTAVSSIRDVEKADYEEGFSGAQQCALCSTVLTWVTGVPRKDSYSGCQVLFPDLHSTLILNVKRSEMVYYVQKEKSYPMGLLPVNPTLTLPVTPKLTLSVIPTLTLLCDPNTNTLYSF